MNYRIEHDSMGEIKIANENIWGAQTQRSFENFKIGTEKMPRELIEAIIAVKIACARANNKLKPQKMTEEKLALIEQGAKEAEPKDFPLSVWQTGSGTQTNMNVNEVIANRANRIAKQKLLHPNDDINMSQSSNDVFPTAMHVSALLLIERKLIPAIKKLESTLIKIEQDNGDAVKTARTHLQDATPITFAQEVSGWRTTLERDREMLESAKENLRYIAIGGTAVGTGLNAPTDFGNVAAEQIGEILGTKFYSDENKFHSLSSKGEISFVHGAVKTLACDLMKIANDVRHLASGPRCGLGEIKIPENEPGSSIMPGKVNPTQCEALTMTAVQVMGNDTAISVATSQGNFQLNVYMPLIIYNFIQSVNLISDAIVSFNDNCAKGIVANKEKMKENLNKSLMTVTALSPIIGYENAARVVHKAYLDGTTLKAAAVALGYMSADEFDANFHPEKMV